MLTPVRPAVLLVDDDLTLLSVLSRRMSRAGYEARTATSGPAALKLLDGSWPALMVVDLMMPGMDGFELCRRVKQIADLPIIVLSAVDASEAKVSALELYAEDYVTKPFDPDELVARVQRVLRRAAVGSPQISLDGGEIEVDLAARPPDYAERQPPADAHRGTAAPGAAPRPSTGSSAPRSCSTACGRMQTAPTLPTCGSPFGASAASSSPIPTTRATWSPSAEWVPPQLGQRRLPASLGGAPQRALAACLRRPARGGHAADPHARRCAPAHRVRAARGRPRPCCGPRDRRGRGVGRDPGDRLRAQPGR